MPPPLLTAFVKFLLALLGCEVTQCSKVTKTAAKNSMPKL